MHRALRSTVARRQLMQPGFGVSRRLSTYCPTCSPSIRSLQLPLDRRRRIQGRSFSSSDDDHFEIERFSNKVLARYATRMGTMSPSLLDETISACQRWCSTGSGSDVDSADRLLKRLISEHAYGSVAARQRTEAIVDLQHTVLKSWLALSSFPLALAKAGDVLMCMIQWHEQGISTQDPFPEMVQVVKACLPAFTEISANLLLQVTQVPNPATASELVPLFNTVLDTCIQENETMTAYMLLQRMETLETEHGWENLNNISDEARKLQMEGPPKLPEKEEESVVEDESFDDTGVEHLSDFELKAIQDRFLNFLTTATLNDKQEVLKMMKQLPSLPQTDVTASLYKGFTDYFIRIEDAKLATQLLSRIDIADDLEQPELTEDLFLGVLKLWVKSDHHDAPWRAQELVSRMEELETSGLPMVSTTSYNLLCEAWAKSNDPAAPDKLEDILSKMLTARSNGDTSKAPNLDTFKSYLSVGSVQDGNHIAQVILELMDQDGEQSKEELSAIVENLLEVLSKEAPYATARQLQERGYASSTLFRQAVSQDLTITPTMCVNLLKSRHNLGVLRELTYLESLPDVAVPLECYESAIMVLLDAPNAPIVQKIRFMARTLQRYAEGKIVAGPSEVGSMLKRVVEKVTQKGQPSDTEAILKVLEEYVLSKEAPIKDVKVPLKSITTAQDKYIHYGGFVRRTFKRYAEGKLSADPNEMRGLMILIMEKVTAEQGPSKAEAMLRFFEKWTLSEEAPIKDVLVPLECFNIVLNGWVGVGDVEKTEATFNRLLSYYEAGHSSLLPSADSLASLLQVILERTKGSPEQIAEKVSGIMKKSLNRYRSTGSAACAPNGACFRHVIHALSRVGTKDAAREILEYLNQMKRMKITPKTQDFNKAMYSVVTLEKSSAHNKFTTLLSLMEQMKELGVVPNAMTYKNLLRACYQPFKRNERSRVLSAAMDAMGQLRKLKQADAGSYGMLAMAMGRQLRGDSTEKRDKLVTTACRLCYEDGFLTSKNVDIFCHAMSSEAWQELRRDFDKTEVVVQ